MMSDNYLGLAIKMAEHGNAYDSREKDKIRSCLKISYNCRE